MSGDWSVQVEAPAKINLGLELLRKRPDGYHEIRTVMAMVGLQDRIEVRREQDGAGTVESSLDFGQDRNLVAVAREAMIAEHAQIAQSSVKLTKHIPFAAGLGGASSDAAATLAALNALLPEAERSSVSTLRCLASSIGSDVPFFLGEPLALATGTGTTIAALPPLGETLYAVLLTPRIELPRKTATLYGAIRPEDFTDGSRTDALVEMVRSGQAPTFDEVLLANPFRAAWRRLGDPIAATERALLEAGAPFAALSGAGPTVYTLVFSRDAAAEIAARASSTPSNELTVHVAPLLTRRPTVVDLPGAHG
ncbi:MAG: 4-(cytidine 5'-diphospho)-2-C-methyl-D-erythritol kinase [Thermomicrobiales bacterium]